MNTWPTIALDAALASKFARVALGHLPRGIEQARSRDGRPKDVKSPAALHPYSTATTTGIRACTATWLIARLTTRSRSYPKPRRFAGLIVRI